MLGQEARDGEDPAGQQGAVKRGLWVHEQREVECAHFCMQYKIYLFI